MPVQKNQASLGEKEIKWERDSLALVMAKSLGYCLWELDLH